ncbi:HERC2 [Symbiodinium microadriaticum]|nr:HERC2 [Symbiodinium microadriaticum]
MTPLHQDEYEDPREIKMIKINRIKATQVRLGAISNQSERIKQSVFGQLHKEMRLWPGSSFRRSYLGKGHGGQKRAFKVTFMGEGVNDYGGPYRAVFQQIVDEVQCDTALVGRKTGDKCLLPLLVPCPNRSSAVGANQDKFLLSSAATTPLSQELMQFFGKICGTAIRHCMNMGLNLSSMLWRPVVGLDISRAHLATIDVLAANDMAGVERLGLELEEDGRDEDGKPLDSSYVPNEWVDLNFTVTTADGSRVSLLPKGTELQVNLGNWREYLRLVERYRLRESTVMYRALCDGLSAVIPTELFPIFTPTELEQLMCGSTAVDINLLRQCTEYDDISPDSTLVKFFWEVLEEMTDDERTLFLRFVWARSRMPASAQAEAHPDDYLPHAQTCFFSLSLPPYSSKEVLRQKILYAINNSPNMDADVRLHNADGWADS